MGRLVVAKLRAPFYLNKIEKTGLSAGPKYNMLSDDKHGSLVHP